MIRLERTGTRSEAGPRGPQRGDWPLLRLVTPAPEASLEAPPGAEEEGGRPTPRVSSAGYEDPHAFVRTWDDPRNIYLA